MEKPVKILHLEDDKLDIELVKALLIGENLLFDLKVVETRQDFLAALKFELPDIILSDYALPSFDGFKALEIASARAPHIPFIFVSGVMGEDAAIESMTRGATDYVLKTKMQRLVPAIKRALEERNDKIIAEQSKDALIKSEKKYRLIAENSLDLICLHEIDGRYTYVSKAAKLILGYDPDELIGSTPYKIIHPEDSDLVRISSHLKAVTGQNGNRVEYRIRHKEGHYVWIETLAMPITDSNNNVVEVQSVSRDITERKKEKEILEKINFQLEEKIKERNKHLMKYFNELETIQAVFTRDFNKPLTFMQEDADKLAVLLKESGPAATEHLAHLKAMLNLMNNNIEQLRFLKDLCSRDLLTEEVNITEIANKLIEKIAKANKEKEFKFRVDNKMKAFGDKELISIALEHLISNAVRFSTRKEIARIYIGKEEFAGREMFYVKDNGIGFDMEEAENIFKPFRHFRTGAISSGYGLAVVSRIINKHGGTIIPDAMPGKGSTFYFSLAEKE